MSRVRQDIDKVTPLAMLQQGINTHYNSRAIIYYYTAPTPALYRGRRENTFHPNVKTHAHTYTQGKGNQVQTPTHPHSTNCKLYSESLGLLCKAE